jgi:hypothetical protein
MTTMASHAAQGVPLHKSFKPILCQLHQRQKPPISGTRCIVSRHLISALAVKAISDVNGVWMRVNADESFPQAAFQWRQKLQ